MMKNLPSTRYVKINIKFIKVGHEEEFEDSMKLASQAMEKVHSDWPLVVYQVQSGATSGTWIVFQPMDSLSGMDRNSARNKTFGEAMGDGGKKFGNLLVASTARACPAFS